MVDTKRKREREYREAVKSADVMQLLAVAGRVASDIGVDACAFHSVTGSFNYIGICDWVDTALIERRESGISMRIGRDFLEQTLKTDEDLTYLIQHELSHMVLHMHAPLFNGSLDTIFDYDQDYARAVRNIAADMQVCSFLHRVWGSTPSLLHRLYSSGVVNALLSTPEMLLNKNWRHGESRICESDIKAELQRRAEDQLVVLSDEQSANLASIYCRVWNNEDVSLDEITMELLELLKYMQNQVGAAIGGDWADMTDGYDRYHRRDTLHGRIISRLSPNLKKQLKRTFDRFEENDILETSRVGKLRNEEVIFRIVTLLKKHFSPEVANPKKTEPLLEGKTLSPMNLGREELFWLSLGYYPANYPYRSQKMSTHSEEIHVYIDVSLSTRNDHRNFLEAISRVFKNRPVLAWVFSDAVRPLNLAKSDLSVVETTGGTDFTPVVVHAVENANRCKRSSHRNSRFIITDGYAPLSGYARQKAASSGLKFHLIIVDSLGHDRGHIQQLEKMFRGLLADPKTVFISSGMLEN